MLSLWLLWLSSAKTSTWTGGPEVHMLPVTWSLVINIREKQASRGWKVNSLSDAQLLLPSFVLRGIPGFLSTVQHFDWFETMPTCMWSCGVCLCMRLHQRTTCESKLSLLLPCIFQESNSFRLWVATSAFYLLSHVFWLFFCLFNVLLGMLDIKRLWTNQMHNPGQ